MNEKTVVLAFVGSVVLIGYREIHASGQLPAPKALLSSAAAFSLLLVLGSFAPQLAGALGIGLLIALLMQPGLLDNVTTSLGGTLPTSPKSIIGPGQGKF